MRWIRQQLGHQGWPAVERGLSSEMARHLGQHDRLKIWQYSQRISWNSATDLRNTYDSNPQRLWYMHRGDRMHLSPSSSISYALVLVCGITVSFPECDVLRSVLLHHHHTFSMPSKAISETDGSLRGHCRCAVPDHLGRRVDLFLTVDWDSTMERGVRSN